MGNNKTLILPDLHLRHQKAEKIINLETPNEIIFLGDIFDDFNDTPEMVSDTAHWFVWSINQKNRIHITGNHDAMYWFAENKSVRCSGYEQYKSILINDIVKKQDWEKLVFFHNLDNKWLMTHGGFHPTWIDMSRARGDKVMEYSIERATKRLSREVNSCKKALYSDKHHWFAMPGFARSHTSPYYGGILWCDWDKEFQATKGLHQLCGHTPNYNLRWCVIKEGGDRQESLPLESVVNPTLSDKNSYNICLDSQPGSRYYAIYEDGNLSIHKSD